MGGTLGVIGGTLGVIGGTLSGLEPDYVHPGRALLLDADFWLHAATDLDNAATGNITPTVGPTVTLGSTSGADATDPVVVAAGAEGYFWAPKESGTGNNFIVSPAVVGAGWWEVDLDLSQNGGAWPTPAGPYPILSRTSAAGHFNNISLESTAGRVRLNLNGFTNSLATMNGLTLTGRQRLRARVEGIDGTTATVTFDQWDWGTGAWVNRNTSVRTYSTVSLTGQSLAVRTPSGFAIAPDWGGKIYGVAVRAFDGTPLSVWSAHTLGSHSTTTFSDAQANPVTLTRQAALTARRYLELIPAGTAAAMLDGTDDVLTGVAPATPYVAYRIRGGALTIAQADPTGALSGRALYDTWWRGSTYTTEELDLIEEYLNEVYGQDTLDMSSTLAAGWVGGVTDTSAAFAVTTTGIATVRVAVSGASDMSSPTYSAVDPTTGTTPNGRWTKHEVSGLTAGTPYYWAVEINGTLGAAVAPFQTFPASGAPASFSFVFGSCARYASGVPASDHAVWANIAAHDPAAFLHLGDFHYRDESSTDPLAHAAHRTAVLTASDGQAALYASVPVAYMPDNHDGVTDASTAGRDAHLASYRLQVPHYPIDGDAAGESVGGQAFTIGRARFLLTDNYGAASTYGATDDASKSKLGAAQKAWLKAQVVAAEADPDIAVIFWSTSSPWTTTKWTAYSTERTELANYFTTEGVTKLILLSGDVHALGADDGTNTPGGFPSLLAAAFDQTSSSAEGPWSEGAYGNPDPQGEYGQFGLVTITDDGTDMSVHFDGRRVDSAGVETSIVTLTVLR